MGYKAEHADLPTSMFLTSSPDPELLTRLIQIMALHPCRVMNFWKPENDNVPNLPLMHEEAFDDGRCCSDNDTFMLELYVLVALTASGGDTSETGSGEMFFDDSFGWGYRNGNNSLIDAKLQWTAGDVLN